MKCWRRTVWQQLIIVMTRSAYPFPLLNHDPLLPSPARPPSLWWTRYYSSGDIRGHIRQIPINIRIRIIKESVISRGNSPRETNVTEKQAPTILKFLDSLSLLCKLDFSDFEKFQIFLREPCPLSSNKSRRYWEIKEVEGHITPLAPLFLWGMVAK